MTPEEMLKVLDGQTMSVEEINMVHLTLISEKLGIPSSDLYDAIAVYAQERKKRIENEMPDLFKTLFKHSDGYNA